MLVVARLSVRVSEYSPTQLYQEIQIIYEPSRLIVLSLEELRMSVDVD